MAADPATHHSPLYHSPLLLLHPRKVVVIVPPPLLNTGERLSPTPSRPLTWPVRAALVSVVVMLAAVFATAVWLDPYDSEGQPRELETHCQLGLPPCSFKLMTGKPCPSCGMTTS